jgi:hypothetical protein
VQARSSLGIGIGKRPEFVFVQEFEKKKLGCGIASCQPAPLGVRLLYDLI